MLIALDAYRVFHQGVSLQIQGMGQTINTIFLNSVDESYIIAISKRGYYFFFAFDLFLMSQEALGC